MNAQIWNTFLLWTQKKNWEQTIVNKLLGKNALHNLEAHFYPFKSWWNKILLEIDDNDNNKKDDKRNRRFAMLMIEQNWVSTSRIHWNATNTPEQSKSNYRGSNFH